MLYAPPTGRMWDPAILWDGSRYRMFAMHDEGTGSHNMWLASSDDGVHWAGDGPVIRDAPFPVWKMFVMPQGDGFVLNHGSFSNRPGTQNDTLRFWESPDMIGWRYLGPECDRTPDPRWYRAIGRCDHMYMIPKEEGDPSAGWWGYVVASTAPSQPHLSVGMMESDDGRDWRWLPPPVIEWGRAPQQLMEVGGCERIGGRYYLILGARFNYMGHGGYSMFTFVADEPAGPFRPDLEAFRLCGNSEDLAGTASGSRGDIGVQTLASFGRGPGGELLLTNYTPSLWEPENEKIVLMPLRSAVVDAGGHLRMGWWPGNDALKGDALGIAPAGAALVRPAVPDEHHHFSPTDDDGLELRDRKVHFQRGAGGGTVVILAERFALDPGIVLEGSMTILDEGWGSDTHLIPVSAGLYLEEEPGRGVAVRFETYGVTRIDRMSIGGDGRLEFRLLDRIGPGCASPGGIPAERPARFRLLLRRDMFEVYLDDLFVQAFFISPQSTGRLGLLVQDGGCRFENLRAYAMGLEADAAAG